LRDDISNLGEIRAVAVILEIKAGPFAGKRAAVMGGQTVTIGRAADRANFALPHDTFMSGVHFAVECGSNGCRLTDRKSSNGTFVNGNRVTEIFLNNGDEVRSGQTIFAVRMVAEEAAIIEAGAERPVTTQPLRPPRPSTTPPPPLAPPPLIQRPTPTRKETPEAGPIGPSGGKKVLPKKAALTIGGWSFASLPEGWEAQGEYGIQRSVQNSFPSSAVASEEPLNNIGLRDYVEAQLSMLRHYLREPQIEAALPPHIGGADETIALEVRYKTKDGQAVFYHRVYARAGRVAGVLTFTTLEAELANVRAEFDAILRGASFAPMAGAQI
jgi:pSer/pThr/pTyr-binding forkhead associated (FHA) protein